MQVAERRSAVGCRMIVHAAQTKLSARTPRRAFLHCRKLSLAPQPTRSRPRASRASEARQARRTADFLPVLHVYTTHSTVHSQ